jgi:hypothetical protein
VVADLATAERRELEGIFRRLRRAAPDPPRAVRDALERAVARALEEIDPVPGGSPPPART